MNSNWIRPLAIPRPNPEVAARKEPSFMTTAKIFIDGESGTTGLGIRERLAALPSVTLKSLPSERRRDPAARRDIMAEVDLVVLCLPDDAAKESAALATSLGNAAPKLLDASTAHRVDPAWVYGFAEMEPGQDKRIAQAKQVANPGCYSTGAIGLIRPLVDAGIMPKDFPVTINAVSGYSGGGKSMIQAHDTEHGPAFELYGLKLEHKHVPETQLFGGLTGRPSGADLRDVLEKRYGGCDLVRVVAPPDDGKLEPEALNGTDRLELSVHVNEKYHQAVLVARLDNLGKGASGAAVQNIGLMLGLHAGVGPREM